MTANCGQNVQRGSGYASDSFVIGGGSPPRSGPFPRPTLGQEALHAAVQQANGFIASIRCPGGCQYVTNVTTHYANPQIKLTPIVIQPPGKGGGMLATASVEWTVTFNCEDFQQWFWTQEDLAKLIEQILSQTGP